MHRVRGDRAVLRAAEREGAQPAAVRQRAERDLERERAVGSGPEADRRASQVLPRPSLWHHVPVPVGANILRREQDVAGRQRAGQDQQTDRAAPPSGRLHSLVGPRPVGYRIRAATKRNGACGPQLVTADVHSGVVSASPDRRKRVFQIVIRTITLAII